MKENGWTPEEDPLEELHRVREQIWRDAGETWEGLFDYIKKREAESRAQGMVIQAPPPKDTPKGEVA